jgi:hypothetical protein
MDFEHAFDWTTLFANAWEPVLGGEVPPPHSAEEWAVFFDRGWDSVLGDIPAEPAPQLVNASAAIVNELAHLVNESVVYDFSNVSWNEGAPGVDATYFDGVSFANCPVSYVTTSAQGPLPYGGSIQLTFELTGGPLKSSTGASDSAGVFLYIQRSGDDWSAQGAFNDYRLWSTSDVWLGGVESGTFSITVPLTPEHWSGVLTEESAAGFAATLASPAVVGLTLYNEIGKGKGSAADSDARIEIIEYKVMAP